jgi:hypothetical protein
VCSIRLLFRGMLRRGNCGFLVSEKTKLWSILLTLTNGENVRIVRWGRFTKKQAKICPKKSSSSTRGVKMCCCANLSQQRQDSMRPFCVTQKIVQLKRVPAFHCDEAGAGRDTIKLWPLDLLFSLSKSRSRVLIFRKNWTVLSVVVGVARDRTGRGLGEQRRREKKMVSKEVCVEKQKTAVLLCTFCLPMTTWVMDGPRSFLLPWFVVLCFSVNCWDSNLFIQHFESLPVFHLVEDTTLVCSGGSERPIESIRAKRYGDMLPPGPSIDGEWRLNLTKEKTKWNFFRRASSVPSGFVIEF